MAKSQDRQAVCQLVSVYYDMDALRQQVKRERLRKVFCRVGSISASEFFSAGQSGLLAVCRVTMFAPEYKGELTVELDKVRYTVYRTYQNGDDIELYLKKEVGA